jgi:hypothetical protein
MRFGGLPSFFMCTPSLLFGSASHQLVQTAKVALNFPQNRVFAKFTQSETRKRELSQNQTLQAQVVRNRVFWCPFPSGFK